MDFSLFRTSIDRLLLLVGLNHVLQDISKNVNVIIANDKVGTPALHLLESSHQHLSLHGCHQYIWKHNFQRCHHQYTHGHNCHLPENFEPTRLKKLALIQRERGGHGST